MQRIITGAVRHSTFVLVFLYAGDNGKLTMDNGIPTLDNGKPTSENWHWTMGNIHWTMATCIGQWKKGLDDETYIWQNWTMENPNSWKTLNEFWKTMLRATKIISVSSWNLLHAMLLTAQCLPYPLGTPYPLPPTPRCPSRSGQCCLLIGGRRGRVRCPDSCWLSEDTTTPVFLY